MKIEQVGIETLTLDPKNARVHNARNLDAIKASLTRFGQQKPVVIDRDNIVRAGNGTVAAARALGWPRIGVVRTKLTGQEVVAYAIADNRLNELSEWDPFILQKITADLLDADFSDAIGFTADEIDSLLADLDGESDEAPPRAPSGAGDTSPKIGAIKHCIIIEAANEGEQSLLLQELEERGLKCRALML